MTELAADELLKVGVAFLVGAVVGIERELRSKPAGFRTMIMICVGSCLFTILSEEASHVSPDRIASNIVTGIGFIGAGVIFKDGLSINGLTTAALIWATAALGMAAGYGNYLMVGTGSGVILFTLFVLEMVQRQADRAHKVSIYRIRFLHQDYSLDKLETDFKKLDIKHAQINISKDEDKLEVTYRFISNQHKYDKLNQYLVENEHVKGFTV